MIISRATAADIDALCALLEVLFSAESEFEPDRDAQARGLAAIVDDPSVGEILVAREPGRVVGMLNILYTVSTASGGPAAVFEDMVVSKDARNAGIGSALLDHAIAMVRGKGCRRVTLLADRNNVAAHRFYRRHGFQSSTMVPFRLPLQPD